MRRHCPVTAGGNMTEIRNSQCPWRKKCGGCISIGEDYAQSLREKERRTAKLLAPYVRLSGMKGMEEPFYYRNKVHRVCTYEPDSKGKRRMAGMYSEGTHRVIPVGRCLLEDQKAQEIIETVMRLAAEFRITNYNEDLRQGLLRHILVRTAHATGQIMVVLVITSPVFPGRKNFIRELCRRHPEITTIVFNINDRNTSMVLSDKESVAYGSGMIEDELCGLRFRISSTSFYQVNPVQTELLYRKAVELAKLTGKEYVLDAYCGIGTIGSVAAGSARKVLGVELNKEAVRDARENARRNRIDNISFLAGDAADYIRRLREGEKTDVIFMDPPRSGASPGFLAAAAGSGASRIVYISCNPETLARDLGILKKKGYDAKQAWAFDLFPWTRHIETCCLLERVSNRKADSYVNLNVKMEDYYRIKDAEKNTDE